MERSLICIVANVLGGSDDGRSTRTSTVWSTSRSFRLFEEAVATSSPSAGLGVSFVSSFHPVRS